MLLNINFSVIFYFNNKKVSKTINIAMILFYSHCHHFQTYKSITQAKSYLATLFVHLIIFSIAVIFETTSLHIVLQIPHSKCFTCVMTQRVILIQDVIDFACCWGMWVQDTNIYSFCDSDKDFGILHFRSAYLLQWLVLRFLVGWNTTCIAKRSL